MRIGVFVDATSSFVAAAAVAAPTLLTSAVLSWSCRCCNCSRSSAWTGAAVAWRVKARPRAKDSAIERKNEVLISECRCVGVCVIFW